MIESVNFVPRYFAEDQVFNEKHAVISITDNDQADARIHGITDSQRLLRVRFLDVEEHIVHPKFKKDFLFDSDKAQTIKDFIDVLHALPEKVEMVVHCEAGASRSAAVALFIYYHTQCEFKNHDRADYANKLVVSVFSTLIEKDIVIPPKAPSDGIILLGNYF
jgi:predicted protein tyrosine phosphatase